MLRGVQDAQVPAQSHRKDAVAQSGYEGGNLGSHPLLTPPARRLILTLRINKAILKCAAIAVRINLKHWLKRNHKAVCKTDKSLLIVKGSCEHYVKNNLNVNLFGTCKP